MDVAALIAPIKQLIFAGRRFLFPQAKATTDAGIKIQDELMHGQLRFQLRRFRFAVTRPIQMPWVVIDLKQPMLLDSLHLKPETWHQ
ncbi:hypothetical protein D9M71_621640 [compost metagenome]